MKAFRPVKTWKNVLGLLLSLGAAFGGLFLVRSRLGRETEILLSDSGQTTIPQQTQGTPMTAESLKTTVFTQEDHLLRFMEDFDKREEAVLHDPLPGQLSMAEAVEKAKSWLEEFFMPGLSAAEFQLSEYRTDCYLWAAGAEEGERNPLYSYWNIALHSRDLEASLTINALTGQILEVSAVCDPPSAYDAGESLPVLLAGYADALRPDGIYSLLFDGDLLLEIAEKPSVQIGSSSEVSTFLYQSLDSHGLYAAVRAESIAVSSPGKQNYREVLSIRLYLAPDSEVRQSGN